MNKFYNGSFYPLALKGLYDEAGTWPENGADVSDEDMAIFTGAPPAGKTLGQDDKGYPVWVGIPALTSEQLIVQAEAHKQRLLDEAQQKISVWQTKLLMGRKLTEAESVKLNAWMDYIDAVTETDTSTAPDIWPPAPV